MLRKWVLLITLSSIALISGCASTGYSSQEDIDKALMLEGLQKDEYLIGPSDVITVSVWRNADLSISVPVRPDGKISMPLVGDVEVNNITPKMLGEKIVNQNK